MMPLEDSFADVLGKACRGLGIGEADLAQRTGISVARVREALAGEPDPEVLRAVAPALELDAAALLGLASGAAVPAPLSLDGLARFTTNFGDMTVNAFLVWDATSKEAALFDTGADADPVLDFLEKNGLRARALFLTHAHGDHIAELDRLVERIGVEAFLGEGEPPLKGPKRFPAGTRWRIGSLDVEARLTCGHAAGGMTFVIQGLPRRVAITGDAIFAGSMGGGMVSYADALRTTRGEILSLPPETILAPGHGPLTTVAWEQTHNPFFAAEFSVAHAATGQGILEISCHS